MLTPAEGGTPAPMIELSRGSDSIAAAQKLLARVPAVFSHQYSVTFDESIATNGCERVFGECDDARGFC